LAERRENAHAADDGANARTLDAAARTRIMSTLPIPTAILMDGLIKIQNENEKRAEWSIVRECWTSESVLYVYDTYVQDGVASDRRPSLSFTFCL